jgi:hypothetical protein
MPVPHNQLTGADLHEPKGVATATAGQVYVADGLGSGDWQDPVGNDNTYVTITAVKAADTSRSSTTTLTADPDLTFSVLANSKYLVRFALIITGGATEDFKFSVGGPASFTLNSSIWYNTGNTTTITGDDSPNDNTPDSVTIPCHATVPSTVWFDGYIATSGTAGTVSIKWAQNTSGATATILKAGSYIAYRKIA